jgi:recombinational DNA repair ATPase RecF
MRRGSRCNAFQASVGNLQNLRFEKERLKFERDMVFEAAIAGLGRVRELEYYQQEFSEQGIEMFCYRLKTLNKLDIAKKKEKKNREKKEQKEETKQEPQLPVSTSKISTAVDSS